jgi:glycosyltransferase involved in cell wall biosynthesis
MKVINIGSDRKVFEKDSSVRKRFNEYKTLAEELHSIVFTTEKQSIVQEGNLTIYPTNSFSRVSALWTAVRMGREVVKKDMDSEWVISTQDPFESGFVGWCISLGNKHAHLHVQLHTDVFSQHFSHGLLNTVRVLLARFIIPRASAVRVVSERIAQSLKVREINLKSEPVVLPIHTDVHNIERIYERKDISENPRVVMVSRLETEKRVLDGIKAFMVLKAEYPRAVMTIVGSGQQQQSLEKFVADLKLEKSVIFAGWQKDINTYFENADIFLHSSSYEGFGLVFVEAALAGLSIVSTAVGLIPSTLRPGKEVLSCEVGDVFCLGESLKKAVTEIELRSNLIESARAAVLSEVVLSKEEYLKQYKESLELSLEK